MLTALIYIIVICGALALVHWAVGALGTPEPVANIVRVIAVVLAIIFIVVIVLNLFGMSTGIETPPLR
jgi:hypothetical protein